MASAEKLAKKMFGAKIIKPLTENSGSLKKKFKLVVFVPLEKTDELTFAMASAGAGNIGSYSVCSFRMKGVGTFMGNEESNPIIGTKGKFEMAEEVRLEMLCDKKNLEKVIDRMYEVHPYDEPAYEVYEVLTGTRKPGRDFLKFSLRKKVTVKSVLKKINSNIKHARLPGIITNGWIRECTIDLRAGNEADPDTLPKETLYIKKSNNKIKAYIT